MIRKPASAEEVAFYEKQLLQEGGTQLHGPVFIARYNQRGYGFGSVLSGLARNVIRVLGKSALLSSVQKSLKKRVLEAGSNLAKDVIEERKGFKRSLKEGAKNLVSNVITDIVASHHTGKGRKRKKSVKNRDIFSKKRKITDVFQA